MTTQRRLLVPLLILFSLSLLVAYAYQVTSLLQTDQRAYQEQLQQAELALDQRLNARQNQVYALAFQSASNPLIQAALANHNRERILNLAQSQYDSLKSELGITELNYYINPTTLFAQFSVPSPFTIDISGTRPDILEVLANGQSLQGLAYNTQGLFFSVILPIQRAGEIVGVVEVQRPLDEAEIQSIQDETGVSIQVLIRRSLAETIQPGPSPKWLDTPTSNLVLLMSALETPIYSSDDIYLLAQEGNITSVRTSQASQAYALQIAPLDDHLGVRIGVLQVIINRTTQANQLQNQLILLSVIYLATILAGIYLIVTWLDRRLAPLSNLLAKAKSVIDSEGMDALHSPAAAGPPPLNDEFSLISTSLDTLQKRLSSQVEDLEQRVAERTHNLERRSLQLQTAAEVARDVASAQNLDLLLKEAVELIRSRFGLYYAAVFLNDELNQYAYLRSGTGEAGEKMLLAGHKLKIGEVGLVGFVTARGQPRVAQDVGADTVHFKNPYLPETRSELALPLKVAGRVIGALDVQSDQPSAFDQQDVLVLQTLADQLAVAIENVRLVEQTEKTLRESRNTPRYRVEGAWITSYPQTTAFIYDRMHISPISPTNPIFTSLPQDHRNRLLAGDPVLMQPDVILKETGGQRSLLLVPVMLRDELIGIIGIEQEDPSHSWTNEELGLVQAIANQAALTLENARLLAETEHQAANQERISLLASRVRQSLDIDNVLGTAAQEIGMLMGIPEVEIRLAPIKGTKS